MKQTYILIIVLEYDTHLISKSIIEKKQCDIKYLYVDKYLTFYHYVIYLTYQNITYNCSTTSNIN